MLIHNNFRLLNTSILNVTQIYCFLSFLSYFSMASSINSSSYYEASSGIFTKFGKKLLRSYHARTPYPTDHQYEELSKKTGCSKTKLAVNISFSE